MHTKPSSFIFHASLGLGVGVPVGLFLLGEIGGIIGGVLGLVWAVYATFVSK